jgi:hypothetical protein
MKKVIVLIFLVFFLASIVAAQVSPEDVREETGKIGTDIKNKTSSLLEEDIVVPEGLQIFTRYLFGIDEGEINFQYFIILFAIWFIFLIVIANILAISPNLEKGFGKWFLAIIFSCLLSFVGITNFFAGKILLIGDFFKNWDKLWPPLKLISVIFPVVIVILFLYAVSIVMKLFRNSDFVEMIREKLRKAGAQVIGTLKKSD